MAERLKRRWFKFMVVFCSLYLAPLSNLFTKVFSFIKPAEALAATVYCYPDSSSREDLAPDECGAVEMECLGWSGSTSFDGATGGEVSCLCISNPNTTADFECTREGTKPKWVQITNCEPYASCSSSEVAIKGKCYPKCITDPDGAVGYVAKTPAF